MSIKSENRIMMAIAAIGIVVAFGVAMLGSYAVTQRLEVLKLQTQLEQQDMKATGGAYASK